MKRTIRISTLMLTCIIILPLMYAPSVLSVIPPNASDIEITSIEKQPGGFVITFTNTGDTYLRGLKFNISVDGGWILPVDFHYDEQLFDCNCTDVMEPDEVLRISTNNHEMFVSFGLLDVTVAVSSSAIGTKYAEQQAFIIGTYIILI